MNDGNDYRIDFTDITINETDGVFEDVNKIMLAEMPTNKNWVLRSSASILTNFGVGNIELQFHADGSVYILDFNTSVGDFFYNPDVSVISQWAQEKGWKIPQPSSSLIKSNKEFWKHFYDTMVIDSDYFDEMFGIRPQLQDKDDKKGKSKGQGAT